MYPWNRITLGCLVATGIVGHHPKIQKTILGLDIAMLQEHLTDVYRHLTNYSINKGAENFQENQRVQADNYGHKWSLSALNRHLRCFSLMEELLASGVFFWSLETP